MRWRNGMTVGFAVLLVGFTGWAGAADNDTKNSREREMLRRAQEALRQSQADNGTLAQSKAETEQKLKAAAAQLDAARNSSRSEQAAVRSKLKAATEAQEEVARQLEDAKKQIATLMAKQQETASQLSVRDSQLKRVQEDLESSRTAGASCEAKNMKLYEYSQDLAQRYQKKGVWAALAQKEPVTGIGAVRTENVVQEYQQKFDSQRLQPTPSRSPPPSQPAAAPPRSSAASGPSQSNSPASAPASTPPPAAPPRSPPANSPASAPPPAAPSSLSASGPPPNR